jgi:hypothetical protein
MRRVTLTGRECLQDAPALPSAPRQVHLTYRLPLGPAPDILYESVGDRFTSLWLSRARLAARHFPAACGCVTRLLLGYIGHGSRSRRSRERPDAAVNVGSGLSPGLVVGGRH